MKVLLISANTEKTEILPLPLGLACVGAACRAAGHEVVLLNLMFEADAESAVRASIVDFHPDVIGISVRNIDNQDMASPRFLLPPVRNLASACRSVSPAPIVLGGAGYSIFPAAALRYLGGDIGVWGDGENTFTALLESLANSADPHGLPGVWLPGEPAAGPDLPANLDALPLPEADLWIPSEAARDKLWIPVQGKRGCPMVCVFCSTKDIQGLRIRRRSAELLVTWMEGMVLRGYRNFVFVDATFNIPPTYAREVCRRIVERGLDVRLWCIIYPKWVDRELVELMARAGCREVSLGFESGSDQVLSNYNKRFHVEEVAIIARMFADAGVRRTGFLLLGGPGETQETVEESLRLAESLELESFKVTVGLRIYPATALASAALARGLIAREDDLLQPKFYLEPELADWLPARIADYRSTHPQVM